ncbi:hypothetical protein OS493_036386, partial [Desmophyllum pertusum]
APSVDVAPLKDVEVREEEDKKGKTIITNNKLIQGKATTPNGSLSKEFKSTIHINRGCV